MVVAFIMSSRSSSSRSVLVPAVLAPNVSPVLSCSGSTREGTVTDPSI